MKKQRQANLELLRIIAMVMVVTAHLVNHGNMITMAAPGSVPYYIVWTLFGVSFTCINIISGTGQIDRQEFRAGDCYFVPRNIKFRLSGTSTVILTTE